MSKSLRMQHAVLYVTTHWKKGKTLAQIAAMHGVDSGNLERAFKQVKGVSFKQFLDEERRKYILTRLQKDHVFGYEIGSELGFADDLAFYRWVQRVFGVSWRVLKRERRVNSNDKK